MLQSEAFSKLVLPVRGRSICTLLCSQQDVVWHLRMWEGRERHLWLEEYVCEWGNGSIAKGQGG